MNDTWVWFYVVRHWMARYGEGPNPETWRNTILHVWIEEKNNKRNRAGVARGLQKENMWYFKTQWKRKFKNGPHYPWKSSNNTEPCAVNVATWRSSMTLAWAISVSWWGGSQIETGWRRVSKEFKRNDYEKKERKDFLFT